MRRWVSSLLEYGECYLERSIALFAGGWGGFAASGKLYYIQKNKYIYFIPFKTHTLYLPSVSSCPTESCSIGRNLRILAKAGRFWSGKYFPPDKFDTLEDFSLPFLVWSVFPLALCVRKSNDWYTVLKLDELNFRLFRILLWTTEFRRMRFFVWSWEWAGVRIRIAAG